MKGFLVLLPVRRVFLRGMLASALAVALTIAFTGVAFAQAPFRASVTYTGPKPSGGCANGAYFCGTANIADYGVASWDLFVLGNTNVQSRCGSTYTAITYFTLASDPASTLVLDEGGDLCGLGHNGAAYRGYFAGGSKDFGHPFAVVGNWTVDPSSTGRFAGLTGSGTDFVRVAGAHSAGSYSGTLG